MPEMNKPFFLDTTVWIHFFRGAGQNIQERVTALLMADNLVTSRIVILELLRGARSRKEFASLQARFSAMRCLEMTDSIWDVAGNTAYLLRKEGVNVPLTDTLIAVLALYNGTILLHDDRHYEMIASVVDLRQQYLKPDNQKPDETS